MADINLSFFILEKNQMTVIKQMLEHDHEQVVFCNDPESGLKAIIAIHDTTLGPALGGLRIWNYATEEEAFNDVLRLSRGMTYKAAVAGLNLGGGKAVIIGDAKKIKSEALFRVFGRFVEGLNGRYITAEDVNTSVKDIEYIMQETKYVTGIPVRYGGSGDPSPFTARGVYWSMRACCKEMYGTDSLNGKKVAIKGLGHVGSYLAQFCYEDGAELIVSDIYEEKLKPMVEKYNATVMNVDDVLSADVDIVAPCALGGGINQETIPSIKAKIICGAANNQLGDENIDGPDLKKRGILYAPDYVVNAGGLINVYNELKPHGYNPESSRDQVRHIYEVMLNIIALSKEKDISTHRAANQIAENRIASIRNINTIKTTGKGTLENR